MLSMGESVGNSEKFKPTQLGANNSFVEPARLSMHRLAGLVPLGKEIDDGVRSRQPCLFSKSCFPKYIESKKQQAVSILENPESEVQATAYRRGCCQETFKGSEIVKPPPAPPCPGQMLSPKELKWHKNFFPKFPQLRLTDLDQCFSPQNKSPEMGRKVTGHRTPPSSPQTRLRKPVVEKMRRDRINSSIEQLKLLLEKEFQRHQPNSKLEKADILEMTVSYLKQQSQLQIKTAGSIHKNSQFDFKEGYSRCLQEAFHFLSLHKVQTETQSKLLSHFQKSQLAAPEVICSPSSQNTPKQAALKNVNALWRPW
ncbi:hypothetical protein KIL84_022097 [Mauremys mutica]|uniref:Transcription factor HES-5 n=1 Tax=Mauremys mutica TaxID=74926 RepID=A0A9D4ATE9_9SAUR|nr:hypothetical protein KIL84_022097 [Mauremys mutica]